MVAVQFPKFGLTLFFSSYSPDDADAYRDRLRVLRMRAGLDNGANTESKVCWNMSFYNEGRTSERNGLPSFVFFYFVYIYIYKDLT